METLTRSVAVRQRVAGWRAAGHAVGFVPTMGNLHEGHLSLVRAALARSERVVVSIFVNPTQFGPGEDFERYPRTLERDADLLAAAGVQLLFAPEVAEVYPDGPGHTTVVDVPELSGLLEGSHRPGHFAGVATVVAKLLNIVQPDVAVFGEKDFQQLAVIRRLVRDLCLPVSIHGAPTVRDDDGLALSSRNGYLGAEERKAAPALYRTLQLAQRELLNGGRDYREVEAQGLAALAAAGFRPDYFVLRRASDLQPPQDGDSDLVLLTAARLGSTRLIDNLRVSLPV